MPIYIQGSTKCPLCNSYVDINDKANVVHFDQFIVNTKDPLYLLSGAICHKQHFNQYPLRDTVLNEIAQRQSRTENAVCYISGTVVSIDNYKNPANLIFTEKFTNDGQDALYKYSYRYLNKYYLSTWNELSKFKYLVRELNSSGLWGGGYLSELLRRLDEPVHPAWSAEMIEKYKERFENDVSSLQK